MCKCAECGKTFQAKRADTAEFCSSKCRMAYNNLEAKRGKQLLGLYVHTRFNRAAASERGLQTLIDRMVGNWVAEDRAAGRREMRPLQEVLFGAVEHVAVVNSVGRAGK